ncbi:hypothetical protein NKH18_05530 [Streptomyces sp. M10(2022)]
MSRKRARGRPSGRRSQPLADECGGVEVTLVEGHHAFGHTEVGAQLGHRAPDRVEVVGGQDGTGGCRAAGHRVERQFRGHVGDPVGAVVEVVLVVGVPVAPAVDDDDVITHA